MFLDHRRHWLEQARYVLSGAAYPLQLAVNSPTAAWRWLAESVATRDALRAQNAELRTRARELELRTMRFEALAHENDELRGLKSALPAVAERWLSAEVVNVEVDKERQRILIDRGTRHGVVKAQAVLGSTGLLGQTLHVGPWSSEVILITDAEHAVPVQIERNGLRTIAVGAGDGESLTLPYLPANADVKAGDLLLTSGLGGVFPQGYPVARVTEVRHDSPIHATPLANVDRLREVMLVWFRADHPAAPAAAANGGANAATGNPALRPQAAPPRATPAPTPAPPVTVAAVASPPHAPHPAAPSIPRPHPAPVSAQKSESEDQGAPPPPAATEGAPAASTPTPAPAPASGDAADKPQ